MPRSARSSISGNFLHVISRGNRRQRIFECDEDYARFRSALIVELAAEGVLLCAYCLMPNHFHIVVVGETKALAPAMHRLLTSHAVYMNKKYGWTGHLFEDRYKSYVCDPAQGLKPLVRYVHLNPVRAHLVALPEDWQWSSHREYLGVGAEDPKGKGLVLAAFDKDLETARKAYAAYVAEGNDRYSPEGDRPSLAVLCANAERRSGLVPGSLLRRSKRRDITGARRHFIESALGWGYRNGEIAGFLGVSASVVSTCGKKNRESEIRDCPL